MTGGLVGHIKHVVLPNIRPLHTVTLTLSFMLPSLTRCAVKSSTFGSLQASTRYTEYLIALPVGDCSSKIQFTRVLRHDPWTFQFNPSDTHVSRLLAIAVPKYSSLAFYVTTLGHFSLIPLIPTLAETPAVVSMFLSFTSLHWLILFRLHQTGTPLANPQSAIGPNAPVASLARAHLLGLVPLYVCCFFIWPLTNLHERLPFVPLLATSVYTALGLCLAFPYFLYMSTFSRQVPIPVATKVTTTMEKAISNRKKNKKMKTQ
ncbi:hypothetical protein AHF37_08639 [Paragonimus kellicotti]|nr:hypothetical protein AHF37_08639 [Paragonimus kellicotti]